MKITTKITARDRFFLALLLIVAILAGAAKFLILPALNQKADLEVELADLEMQRKEMEYTLVTGDKAAADLDLAQQQLATSIKALPVVLSNKELDELITGLELECDLFPDSLMIQDVKAKESLVLPYSLAAGAAKMTGGALVTSTLNVKCTGNQTDFLRLMDILSEQYHYIRLTKLTIGIAIDDVQVLSPMTMPITCSFEVYMYSK